MTATPITLVGDGIENPWNARTLLAAAALFGSPCVFRDRCDLARAWQETIAGTPFPPTISPAELAGEYSPIVALDNLPGADSVYGFQVGRGPRPAMVVGNERKGIARDVTAIRHRAVQIPMASRRLNCLNVAAASAVALYYVSRGGGGKLQSGGGKRRPEVWLLGAADHVELGSSIRSAGAFGWGRLFVEDREGVWFNRDRATLTEGRAAARSARNPIRVVPASADRGYAFDQACIVTLHRTGIPLHQAQLARGASQVIVIPDETAVDPGREDWHRLARDVRYVHLPVPFPESSYHYRLIASIVLAEVARQVGQAAPSPARPRRHEPLYDRVLELLSEERGETIDLSELEGY